MKASIKAMMALLAVISVAACSGKVTPKGPISGPIAPPSKGVKFLGLEGTHESQCLKYPLGGYYKISFVVKNAETVQETQFFGEADCRTLQRKESLKGTLQDAGAKGSNRQVKLFIPIDANVSTWRYFLINTNGGQTSMSDFALDLADLKDTPIRLFKTASVSAAPAAPAAPAPAAPAKIDIQSGDYAPVGSPDRVCNQNVGVSKVGSRVSDLYVTVLSPCRGKTFMLSCDEKGVCTDNDGWTITILGSDHYRLETRKDSYEFKRR